MTDPTPATSVAFLDELIPRHRARLPHDHAYEAMMYAARHPPTKTSLAALLDYLDQARADARCDEHTLQTIDLGALAELLAGMVWPDPAPMGQAARLVAGWNTVAVSTLLHTQIPDYPIFGPAEANGLQRLGYEVTYEDDPAEATRAYGRTIRAIKTIREEARHDQVPESHHFLTRIVQTALEETGGRTR